MAITLEILEKQYYQDFIQDLQNAFQTAFDETFRQEENNEPVISEEEILQSLNGEKQVSYRILSEENWVGGIVLTIDETTQHNALDLLYVKTNTNSKGIGTEVWKLVEKLYPKTQVWETHTPYFDKRNIHFYVNKCSFHIVEFFSPHHPSPHEVQHDSPELEYFFRFEKKMTPQ